MTATDPNPAERRSSGPTYVLIASAGVLAIALAALVLGARQPRQYDVSSPDGLIAAAADMIETGHAERIPELFEIAPPGDTAIDRERTAELYARLGRVFGALQGLSRTIAEEMPEQLERFRRELASAEADGRASSFLAAIASQRGSRGGSRGSGPFGVGFFATNEQRDATVRALGRVLADPYEAFDDASARVSFVTVDDRTSAVLFDGDPVLPPLGLLVRRDDEDRWRIVPPTNAPVAQRLVSRIRPRTEEQYLVFASLLQAVENVILDLDADIRSGRIDSFQELADGFFSKAAIPTAMIVYAYARAFDEEP